MSSGVSGASGGLQAAVAERLDNLKSAKVRYWAPFVLGAMMMGDSWDIAVIGYAMPSLRQEWGLTPILAGTLISAGFLGQSIGALFVGPLAEKLGRIRVLFTAIVVMSLLSLACALVKDPQAFIALRFLQGIGFGGAVPACIAYVNELAPTASRGRYFSMFQFLMICGFSVCGFAAAVVIPAYGWRAMFLIGAFPILFAPFLIATLPESPRWLAKLGRVEATNKALAKLGAAPVDASLTASVEVKAARVPLSALFTPAQRWLTVSTLLLWFCMSIDSYGFSTWVPTLYVDIFKLPLATSLHYSALTGVAYMITPLIFAVILDRVGRRPAGIFIGVCTLSILAALAFFDRNSPSHSVLLMALGWVSAGSGFILMWPYTAEIFPTEIRSTALGLCSAMARLGSTSTPLLVAGVLSSTGSLRLVWVALGIPALIVLLIWMFAAKEMAQRRLDGVE